jgi:hypothetical protein
MSQPKFWDEIEEKLTVNTEIITLMNYSAHLNKKKLSSTSKNSSQTSLLAAYNM